MPHYLWVGEKFDDVVGAHGVTVERGGIATAEERERRKFADAVAPRDFATKHLRKQKVRPSKKILSYLVILRI